jgi:hypothetical protein
MKRLLIVVLLCGIAAGCKKPNTTSANPCAPPPGFTATKNYYLPACSGATFTDGTILWADEKGNTFATVPPIMPLPTTSLQGGQVSNNWAAVEAMAQLKPPDCLHGGDHQWVDGPDVFGGAVADPKDPVKWDHVIWHHLQHCKVCGLLRIKPSGGSNR